MSLAAWMPSSFRFFSICLLRARAARSSADEAQPMMAMARTAWLATRGSAVLRACSRLVVARRERRARARSRTRATGRNASRPGATSKTARVAAAPCRLARIRNQSHCDGTATWTRDRMTGRARPARWLHCASAFAHPVPPDTLIKYICIIYDTNYTLLCTTVLSTANKASLFCMSLIG